MATMCRYYRMFHSVSKLYQNKRNTDIKMLRNLLIKRCSPWQSSYVKRMYCQESRKCWNCSTSLRSNTDIFCSSCQSIQNLPKIDYFKLFDIKPNHKINTTDLTSRFRSFQSQIHPDKFSGKSEEEQALSAEWSSLINKAYRVLQAPLERGEYLLRLHGVTLPENNTISDPEFLTEMMERNEEVDEATSKEELTTIIASLKEESLQLSDDFSLHFDSGNLDGAKMSLIKMKYLTSIEKAIKEKLLRL